MHTHTQMPIGVHPPRLRSESRAIKSARMRALFPPRRAHLSIAPRSWAAAAFLIMCGKRGRRLARRLAAAAR